MLSTLLVLLPVFGLVLAGYAIRCRGILGASAATELNRFVIWLALPALLFDGMSRASWSQLYQPGFIAAFGLACAAVFGIALAWRMLAGRGLADASVDAVAASYPNTAYLGIPLCLMVFGTDSLAPSAIATIVVVSGLFSAASVLVEIGTQTEHRPLRMGIKVAVSVARNPMVVAPLAGLAMSAGGWQVPAAASSFLRLLGAAASPCALVALGLFLADTRHGPSHVRDSAMLATAKLVLQPVLTWVLAVKVFALPPTLANMAVLLAALPTGTGPFMLAEFYRREACVTARTILLSTLASIGTLTLLLQRMPHAS